MKIVITGGRGFLGKHVIRSFCEKMGDAGHAIYQPSSTDMNVLDIINTRDYLNNIGADVILHMAAKCGGILANKNSPADFLRDNTQMALNIYEATHKCGIKSVYSLGSVCAYPKYCPVPFREDDIWNGSAEETNFPYGQAKRTLMMLGQTYRQQYGIGGAHLIPVNMYGEHDHFDLTNSHVIPALINKFDYAITNELPQVECWGTGEATREFLYAGDAADAIAKAVLINFDTNLPVNIGTGQEISIKDLSHLIGKLMGYNGEIIFTGEVSDGQPKRRLDVSRAKQLLKWESKTSLKDGLLQTIKWYQQNKNLI
jgi:GDP-L-fucose synthase